MHKKIFFFLSALLFIASCSAEKNSMNALPKPINISFAYVEETFNPDDFNVSNFSAEFEEIYEQQVEIDYVPFSSEMELMLELKENPTSYDLVFAKDFILNDLAQHASLVDFDLEPSTNVNNYAFLEEYIRYENSYLRKYWNRVFSTDKNIFKKVVGLDFSLYGVVYKPGITGEEELTALEKLEWREERELLKSKANIQNEFLQFKWNMILEQDKFSEGYKTPISEPRYLPRYWNEQFSLTSDGEDQKLQHYLKSLNDPFALSRLNDNNYAFVTNSEFARLIQQVPEEDQVNYRFEFSSEVNVLEMHGFGLLSESKKEAAQLFLNAILKPDNMIKHGTRHYKNMFLGKTPLHNFLTSLEVSDEETKYDLTYFLKENTFDSTRYEYRWPNNSVWKLIYPPEAVMEGAFGLFDLTLRYPNLVEIWTQKTLTSFDFTKLIIPLIIVVIIILLIIIVGLVFLFMKRRAKSMPKIKDYRMAKIEAKYQRNPEKHESTYKKTKAIYKKQNKTK